MTQLKLAVTEVRYFETRRGTGYQCTTNVKNVEIWNDGNGGGTWIPPHGTYTKPYSELTGMELESLIDDYEKKIDDRLEKTIQKYKKPHKGDKSSDAYDEERLKTELNWWRNYGYYVANKHNNVDAEACGYADGDEEYLKS